MLLLSEERSFRLNGALYADLLPRLDGSLTGRQVVAAFRSSVPEAEMIQILEGLHGKGYLVTLPDRGDLHLAAYWSAQGEQPVEADRRLRSVPVGVVALGQGPAAGSEGAGALLSLLAGSGLAVAGEAEAGLLFVLVDDYLQPALAEFATAAAAAARSWIPFKPGGLSAWIGPHHGPGEPPSAHPAGLDDPRRPCFHCLARRLITHRPGDTLVQAPVGGLRPARAWTAGSLALARGIAVTEAIHQVRGEASRLDRNLLTLHGPSGAAETHLAPRFQDCPHCGAGAPAHGSVPEPTPIRLAKVARGGDGDGGWRALTAEQALARLEPLISPLTGIVSHARDHELSRRLYLSIASQANRERVDPRENRRLGKPGAAGGKGLSRIQARVSCLAEAVERYACGWTGSEPRRRARYAELAPAAVHPRTILGFSERQYDLRAELNKGASGMHHVPERFREDAEVDWTPAWSLTADAPRWLPTRFCYFDYRAQDLPEDHPFCLGDSNGCASGGTLEEAILQGLLEVVERDAISVWWYNRLARPAAGLDGIEPRFLAALRSYCESRDLAVEVLDLTTDLAIPAMAAVAHNRTTGREISIGFGAHPDATVAATRALTELNQSLYFNLANEQPEGGEGADFGEARHWYQSASVAEHPYLLASGGAPSDLESLSRRGPESIDEAVRDLVGRLAEAGHEVVAMDYDRRDVPLACVKVVVPGLCHFWNRRGEPRLFQSPVRQGLFAAPLSEDRLNPLSFFI